MEKEIDEIRFADAFNKGYLMFQYEPEIAKSFIDNNVAIYDDFSAGFSDGLNQAQQEKIMTEFEQLRNDSNEQSVDLER